MEFRTNFMPEQLKQVWRLIHSFPTVFSSCPGETKLAAHCIHMEPGSRVRENTCPLPHQIREMTKKELRAMLDLGVIEESHRD